MFRFKLPGPLFSVRRVFFLICVFLHTECLSTGTSNSRIWVSGRRSSVIPTWCLLRMQLPHYDVIIVHKCVSCWGPVHGQLLAIVLLLLNPEAWNDPTYVRQENTRDRATRLGTQPIYGTTIHAQSVPTNFFRSALPRESDLVWYFRARKPPIIAYYGTSADLSITTRTRVSLKLSSESTNWWNGMTTGDSEVLCRCQFCVLHRQHPVPSPSLTTLDPQIRLMIDDVCRALR